MSKQGVLVKLRISCKEIQRHEKQKEYERTNEEDHTFPVLIRDIICPSISSKGFMTPFLLCMKTLGTKLEAMKAKEREERSTNQEEISREEKGASMHENQRGGQAFISTGGSSEIFHADIEKISQAF